MRAFAPDEICLVLATGETAGTVGVNDAIGRARCICVNDAFRLAPWAEALYACDFAWWYVHHEATRDFQGEKLTTDRRAAERFGVTLLRGEHRDGLSTDPAFIHFNKNSGAQALNIATLAGARRLLLVGFDMGGTHFFGDHPKPLRRDTPFAELIGKFGPIRAQLAGSLAARCVVVGLESRLRSFPKVATVAEGLAALMQ